MKFRRESEESKIRGKIRIMEHYDEDPLHYIRFLAKMKMLEHPGGTV